MNKTVAMTLIAIRDACSRWIDSVANFVSDMLGRFASPRTIRLVENENGEFVPQVNQPSSDLQVTRDQIRVVDGGIDNSELERLAETLSNSQIELVLRPDRFIFRPLELPNRASEFMPGIVRSQIDRLTPWNADNAAFGWSQPIETDAEKMAVTIAATALNLIKPYVQAIVDFGAQSIAVFTTAPEDYPNAELIKVWEERGRGAKNISQIRKTLIATLAAVGIIAGVALGADTILTTSLSGQQEELARQISEVRAAAGLARTGGSPSPAAVKRELERRKHEAPLTVLAVESLSKILPDDTYVTEVHVEGNKLRLTGITRNAAALVGLIEQSGRFTRASFFAPTTRSPNSDDEHFNIEAIVQPFGPLS